MNVKAQRPVKRKVGGSVASISSNGGGTEGKSGGVGEYGTSGIAQFKMNKIYDGMPPIAMASESGKVQKSARFRKKLPSSISARALHPPQAAGPSPTDIHSHRP